MIIMTSTKEWIRILFLSLILHILYQLHLLAWGPDLDYFMKTNNDCSRQLLEFQSSLPSFTADTIAKARSETTTTTTVATSNVADMEVDDDDVTKKTKEILNLHLDGYTPSRIKLKDLNFCNIGTSGMTVPLCDTCYKVVTCIRNDTTVDPSCDECLKPNSKQLSAKIWNTYEKNAKTRRQMISDGLEGKGGNAEDDDDDDDDDNNNKNKNNNGVVVIMANHIYLNMTAKWWCFASQNGLNRRNVILYALDDTIADWAKSQGIFTIMPTIYSIDLPRYKGYMNVAYKYSLYPLIADLLHMGRHVVYNDVDLLWTSNLLSNLQNYWTDIPLVTQVAPRWDAQGPLNSGMVSLRPTPQTKIFIETMMETIPIFMSNLNMNDDQLMWNQLLRHHKFRSLPFRTLPNSLVVNGGRDRKLSGYTNLTWCIHWVGIKLFKNPSYSSFSESYNC